MGLTQALLRVGAARPHVMIVSVPGGTAVRLAAEAELRRRGWPAALSPADADVLLVAGAVPKDLDDPVEEVWRAVPAPRARMQAASPDEVAAVLDRAGSLAGDLSRQRAALPVPRDPPDEGEGPQAGGGPAGMQMPGGTDMPGGMDMADEMGMAGGMDMAGGMGMAGGLPVASRGEDRDGLKLDQLHVPLGPFLPDWPAGLVVRVTLQGDVIQHATAGFLGVTGAGRSYWYEPWLRAAAGDGADADEAARRRLASHLDSLGRFLAVAGWDLAAATARRLRDESLAGAPAATLEPAIRNFARRVGRSRVLAWATRGLGVLTPGEAVAAGVGGPALRAGGDVCARYRQWCAEVAEAAAVLAGRSPTDPGMLEGPRGPLAGQSAPSAGLVAVLPGLLAGAEFAAARLIIASLDPDADELAPAGVGAAHGG